MHKHAYKTVPLLLVLAIVAFAFSGVAVADENNIETGVTISATADASFDAFGDSYSEGNSSGTVFGKAVTGFGDSDTGENDDISNGAGALTVFGAGFENHAWDGNGGAVNGNGGANGSGTASTSGDPFWRGATADTEQWAGSHANGDNASVHTENAGLAKVFAGLEGSTDYSAWDVEAAAAANDAAGSWDEFDTSSGGSGWTQVGTDPAFGG